MGSSRRVLVLDVPGLRLPSRRADGTMPTFELRLSESNQMVSAFATQVAEAQGLRVLLLKGPPATALGVRAERPSVNIDLWVEPVCFAFYLSLLEGHGWHRLPASIQGKRSSQRIILSHMHWISTLQVHRAFPGFTNRAEAAFEAIWAQRDHATLGTQDVAVPGVVAAAAIATLNAARNGETVPETLDDLALAVDRAAGFTSAQQADLSYLATLTDDSRDLAVLLHAVVDDDADPRGPVVPQPRGKGFTGRLGRGLEGRPRSPWRP